MFSLWLLLSNSIWRLILAIAYNKQIMPLAGTLTRGLARFARILAHLLAPQSLALCDLRNRIDQLGSTPSNNKIAEIKNVLKLILSMEPSSHITFH